MHIPHATFDTRVQGNIVAIDESYFILKAGNTNIKVYYQDEDFSINDELDIEITYRDIPKQQNENAFDYQRYLYSNNIASQANLTNVISKQAHPTLYHFIESRINLNQEIKSYASLFLLGIKDTEMQEIYNNMTALSIVHLFALSGMHLQILYRFIEKFMRIVFQDRKKDLLILLFLGIYVFSLPYNISFYRAYIMMALQKLSNKKISALDALSMSAIGMIFLNSYCIYHLSFIFSYFISFVIILLHNYKYQSFLIFLGSLPIILMTSYQINIMSLVLSIVFLPFISYFYLGFVAYFILPNMFLPIQLIFIRLFSMMLTFSNVISFFIPFSKPNLFFLFSYYFIYFSIIYKINQKRRWIKEGLALLSILFVFYCYSHYFPFTKVVMIDVDQGDCFLISQSFNRGNILIDTGGIKNQDVASNRIVPYLHSIGVFDLDYVYLSHHDFDHSGALTSLQNQIPIHHIIDTYESERDIGDVKIKMLQTSGTTDNDQSLVMYVSVNSFHYLFTGDISAEIERELYEKYGKLDVDVLKVAHHGSKTSSSNVLFQMINPKIAWISVGENNYYGHPSEEVIERLTHQGIKIYRSDQDGMVTIIDYFGKHVIYKHLK